jgi:hypothetical protein
VNFAPGDLVVVAHDVRLPMSLTAKFGMWSPPDNPVTAVIRSTSTVALVITYNDNTNRSFLDEILVLTDRGELGWNRAAVFVKQS